ncbi:conserved protein, unknown function [Hepatocystis sp. ex Piliocolobus tephrosceles]|nr:conserved protein, unknown function [Hepatocystis sp. ex Piliocolobus tephrosceles]
MENDRMYNIHGNRDTNEYDAKFNYYNNNNMANMVSMTNMSNIPNMANMSNMTNIPNMTNMSNMVNIPNITNMSNITNMTNMSNMNRMNSFGNMNDISRVPSFNDCNNNYYNSYEKDGYSYYKPKMVNNMYNYQDNKIESYKVNMNTGAYSYDGNSTASNTDSNSNILNNNYNITNSNYQTGNNDYYYYNQKFQTMDNSGYLQHNLHMRNNSVINNNVINNNMINNNYTYEQDQYILNKQKAKILYIYNITSEYTDENFIYSLCYIYGNVESVSYIKGKNVFIIKFELAECAMNAYKNLPLYLKDLQFELRNESKKITSYNERVNSHKYITPIASEKRFLSLSVEKREVIMNIKQKELLRKCKEKLNEYIEMLNNENITDETKQKLQTLIDQVKLRIQFLNNQCDKGNLNEIANFISSNDSDDNNNNANVSGDTRDNKDNNIGNNNIDNNNNNNIGNNTVGNNNNNNSSNNNNNNNSSSNNNNSSSNDFNKNCSNNDNTCAEGSTTIKINLPSNIQNNEQLSNYIIKNNSVFLNEDISYFSLFYFNEKYAIIKYSNQSVANNVLRNCHMCSINAEFVPDDIENPSSN